MDGEGTYRIGDEGLVEGARHRREFTGSECINDLTALSEEGTPSFEGLIPESQGQNLALTVLHVRERTGLAMRVW